MIIYVIIIIILIKFVCAFFEYARDVFVWGIEVFYSILCVIQIFFFTQWYSLFHDVFRILHTCARRRKKKWQNTWRWYEKQSVSFLIILINTDIIYCDFQIQEQAF